MELEAALLDPRFQAAAIPENLRVALGGAPIAASLEDANETAVVATAVPPAPAIPMASVVPPKRVMLDEALRGYFDFIRTDNAARHVENKLSMLRRFLGTNRTEQFVQNDDAAARTRRLKNAVEGFFAGTFVDELTPSLLQDFFTQLEVSVKTKRHYREFFHHFFEHCINFGLLRPENYHCPNPTAALPTYLSRNRRIVFLDQDQIDAELRVLEPHPALRIAVAIMIHAGLRRAETLWLTRDALSPDLSFLSVVNRVDHETDLESSLKTGERTVTILPSLRPLLKEYLTGLRGRWLIPSSTGSRWHGDAFGKRLRAINALAGQKWTCLHYRHTYATRRAAEGWPLFRIAKEMGNSAAVVEEYYAGFIHPHSIATAV
ncbi:MAG: tyrosine-type recombinase/integrase [Chthoniobacter sp.]|nr:tyrosine-type recombinase/integrase [Chthoniobacter sp.]